MNPGTNLNFDWLDSIQMNRSAIERRCATLIKRRSIKKEWQAAWLLRSISCMDLTTLSSDDTSERVRRLCAKAKQPLSFELVDKLGVKKLRPRVAAVCVYHSYVKTAVDELKNSGIPVAAVSTGFPHGLISISRRIEEIKDSIASGASEIDIVITRAHVFSGNWQALYDEILAFKKACGEKHLKTILGTGELGTFRNIAKASLVCMMAGADFIKTSTGKENVNATLPVSLVMLRMIREYFNSTGFYVGFKPAGGISTAKQSLEWLILMKEELGLEWVESNLFRFGASGLLNDIERQLEHFAKGSYSASYRHPVA
tara:strand:- start:217 stop:1158 length:942 start_codon:yes stop_codon:yes gene_type:complete